MPEEMQDLNKLIATGRAVKEYELNGIKFVLSSPTSKQLLEAEDVASIIAQYISKVGSEEFTTPERKKLLQNKLLTEAPGALMDTLFGICKDFRDFQDGLIKDTLKKN